MSNKIFIKFTPAFEVEVGKSISTVVAPLTDDIGFECGSEYTTLNELIPAIGGLADTGQNFWSGLTGTANSALLTAQTILHFPKWSKTNPLSLSCKLMFYTETDPKADVYAKIAALCSLSILHVGEGMNNNTYTIPGVSAANASEFLKGGKGAWDQLAGGNIPTPKNEENAKSKNQGKYLGVDLSSFSTNISKNLRTISVYIPGIIYLPQAFVEASKPTFSKQITESGFPLWGEVELNIRSLFPATQKHFTSMMRMGSIHQRIQQTQSWDDNSVKGLFGTGTVAIPNLSDFGNA